MNALFASDNVTSACPEVINALIDANAGIAESYGDDEWSLTLKKYYLKSLKPMLRFF